MRRFEKCSREHDAAHCAMNVGEESAASPARDDAAVPVDGITDDELAACLRVRCGGDARSPTGSSACVVCQQEWLAFSVVL